VSNIYRPPKQPINWFNKMNTLLDNFSTTKLDFIITGDMNCDLLKTPIDNHTKHLIYTCETHKLTQLVNKPTRITPSSLTLIDMIMVTNPDKIIEHDVRAVGIANHCLVYCVTSYKSQTPTQSHRTIEMRNFKNFNLDDFLLDLEQCDWASIEELLDVDDAYQKWKELFIDVCDKHCSFITLRVRKTFLLV
jgi:hypothetical protein